MFKLRAKFGRAEMDRLERAAAFGAHGNVSAAYDRRLGAVFVELREPYADRAWVLHTWMHGIDVTGMIAGRDTDDDARLHLTVRGTWAGRPDVVTLLPAGQPVVVTAAWSNSAPEADAIRDGVDGDPDTLVWQLIELSGMTGVGDWSLQDLCPRCPTTRTGAHR